MISANAKIHPLLKARALARHMSIEEIMLSLNEDAP
jgi:hypothetical protein